MGCNNISVNTPSAKSLTIISVIVNVVLLSLLSTIILLLRYKEDTTSQCAKTGRHSVNAITNRYCVDLDTEQCRERGLDVKHGVNDSVCCGNLGEHIYDLMAEVSCSE